MVIAVDFDEVIHDRKHPESGRRLGLPIAGSREALRELRTQGHELIVHSVVPESVIADWMSYFDIPYDRYAPKPQADIYIDDKAFKFNNWSDTMGAIEALHGSNTRGF